MIPAGLGTDVKDACHACRCHGIVGIGRKRRAADFQLVDEIVQLSYGAFAIGQVDVVGVGLLENNLAILMDG